MTSPLASTQPHDCQCSSWRWAWIVASGHKVRHLSYCPLSDSLPLHRRPQGLTSTLYLGERVIGVGAHSGEPIRYTYFDRPTHYDRGWELSYEEEMLTVGLAVAAYQPSLVWSYDPVEFERGPQPLLNEYASDGTTHSPRHHDYPIYHKLASERNWAPMGQILHPLLPTQLGNDV